MSTQRRCAGPDESHTQRDDVCTQPRCTSLGGGSHEPVWTGGGPTWLNSGACSAEQLPGNPTHHQEQERPKAFAGAFLGGKSEWMLKVCKMHHVRMQDAASFQAQLTTIFPPTGMFVGH